ncbi:hypothetical protein OESDEN_15338, partial [Oesophagostomum dentatum]
LAKKRACRCDCGNSKFKTKCTLYEDKEAVNTENAYNDNFIGLFCVCKKPYPCELDETMHQCMACEDWFHLSALYERAGCEFFIDTDDDIELFTKENIEKTEGEKEPDDETIVNELVQTAGRDAAIHVLKGFNELKRNLHEFMREKQEEGVGVITAEHITSFFDKIKRSRLEDTSGDDV